LVRIDACNFELSW